jgi:hypothetical protein
VLTDARKLYRQLAAQWHPDKPGGDAVVFAHLAHLYAEAQAKLAQGRWEGPNTVVLPIGKGAYHVLQVRASAPFPLGQQLIGDDFVGSLIEPQFQQLVLRASNVGFTYASPRMEEEFARYLPTKWAAHHVIPLTDGRYFVRVSKTPDLIRLRDVVTHLGPLDAKHVAWIVSSLVNLCCYLSFAKLAHHDISPDTYFISPGHHSGALLGGWWYYHRYGERVALVPARTFSVLPFSVRVTKRAGALTDMELVRLTAREIAGPLPEPMRSWLTTPGTGSAYDQYQQWAVILEKTFGKRRFTPMLVSADDVYSIKGRGNGADQ